LIYEDILLTAAHCQKAFISNGVYIGGTSIDGSESEYVPVDSEYPHANYTPGYEYNDIMLVKLSSPSAAPIVTIDNVEVMTESSSKQTAATVIGYGYTSTGSGATYSKLLLQTEIDLLPMTQCFNYYGPDLSKNTMLCATGNLDTLNNTTNATADACLGDSGGPLLLPFYENMVISTSRTGNGSRGSQNVTVKMLAYKQIGIVSFGDGWYVVLLLY
jgi:secreted trypsin-like serine protease